MILRAIVLMIVSMIFSGCDIQNKLLYYPSSSLPSAETLRAYNVTLWSSSPNEYRGLVSINVAGSVKGTIVVFHGNGGTASDRIFYVKPLTELGYRVILAEYPAYGGRKGEVGERSYTADAVETLRLASGQYKGPVFLLGESLGCGVAAAAARHTDVRVSGIILITPWDTLASIAKSKFPYLPVSWFLKDNYDNIENLQSFGQRIAVIGAERDEVIPLEHARRLYLTLPAEARMIRIIKDAGHNDWPMFVDKTFFMKIMDYVRGNGKT
jgi:uncharacterized protein